jgi:hypothetical protein
MWYCRHVSRKSAEWTGPVGQVVIDRRYPSWRFVVEFDEEGRASGFAVEPRRTRAFLDDRGQAVSADEYVRRVRNGEKPVEVAVRPDHEISARWMRGLPVGELIARGRESVAHASDWVHDDTDRAAWAQRFLDRPGSRGRSDADYARVAVDYAAIVASGARRPNEQLAAMYHLSTSQVTSLVYEARTRKMLTETVRGRAGGEPTVLALQLLREASSGEHH